MYFRWTLLYGLKLVVKSNYERKVHKIAFIFYWVNLRKNFTGLHKNTKVTKKLPVVTTQRLILNKKDHLIDLTTQDPTVTTAFTDSSSVSAVPTVISDLQRRVTRVLKGTGAYRTKRSDVLQMSYGCGIRPAWVMNLPRKGKSFMTNPLQHSNLPKPWDTFLYSIPR